MTVVGPRSGQEYSVVDQHADRPSANSLSDSEGNDSDDDAQDFSSVAPTDRNVLQEEEERETLLSTQNPHATQQALPSSSRHGKASGAAVPRLRQKPEQERTKGRRRKKPHGRKELLYEMEKGGWKDDLSSRSSSSSLELDCQDFEQSRSAQVRD